MESSVVLAILAAARVCGLLHVESDRCGNRWIPGLVLRSTHWGSLLEAGHGFAI